jgi:hypothetical protein
VRWIGAARFVTCLLKPVPLWNPENGCMGVGTGRLVANRFHSANLLFSVIPICYMRVPRPSGSRLNYLARQLSGLVF